MKRTQVQLPDKLYQNLKKRAAQEETSLAEIVRKAGEFYLSLHPEAIQEADEWDIPEPVNLGEFLSPEGEWRLQANEDNNRP